MDAIKAKEPFKFYARLHLTELTGLRATTLWQLLELIREVPGSSIYHHTHRFLQQHQFLSPEPPNDFAYWVTDVLGETELGEKLASIDTVQFATIRSLRDEIARTIEEFIVIHPLSKLRFALEGEEFYFVKSVSFIFPTDYAAADLVEFSNALSRVTLDSVYFHIFESRLRLEKQNNDFSNWIEHSLGDKKLADAISRLDPYTQTLDGLRKSILSIVEKRMGAA